MSPETVQAVREYGANVTAILLVGSFAIAGVYDVMAALTWGREATVSAVVRQWSADYPAFPLAVGAIMGHLFWR